MFRILASEESAEASDSSSSSEESLPSVNFHIVKRELELPKCVCRSFLSLTNSKYRGRLRNYCTCKNLGNLSHLD